MSLYELLQPWVILEGKSNRRNLEYILLEADLFLQQKLGLRAYLGLSNNGDSLNELNLLCNYYYYYKNLIADCVGDGHIFGICFFLMMQMMNQILNHMCYIFGCVDVVHDDEYGYDDLIETYAINLYCEQLRLEGLPSTLRYFGKLLRRLHMEKRALLSLLHEPFLEMQL